MCADHKKIGPASTNGTENLLSGDAVGQPRLRTNPSFRGLPDQGIELTSGPGATSLVDLRPGCWRDVLLRNNRYQRLNDVQHRKHRAAGLRQRYGGVKRAARSTGEIRRVKNTMDRCHHFILVLPVGNVGACELQSIKFLETPQRSLAVASTTGHL